MPHVAPSSLYHARAIPMATHFCLLEQTCPGVVGADVTVTIGGRMGERGPSQ
jgi:hypothetical protein